MYIHICNNTTHTHDSFIRVHLRTHRSERGSVASDMAQAFLLSSHFRFTADGRACTHARSLSLACSCLRQSLPCTHTRSIISSPHTYMHARAPSFSLAITSSHTHTLTHTHTGLEVRKGCPTRTVYSEGRLLSVTPTAPPPCPDGLSPPPLPPSLPHTCRLPESRCLGKGSWYLQTD